jgi:DNA-binding transcriptional MerR regulator
VSELELPDKLYFKIGEVAKLVGVKPYVLRYWETEFSVLRPGKTRSSHRLYRRRDVETLLEIRRLLYGERYTIEGAKRRLREVGRAQGAATPQAALAAPDGDDLRTRIRQELVELYRMLEAEPEPRPLTIGKRAR